VSTLNVDKVDPSTGTALEIGSSGDTITIPSGATITNSGTANGFGPALTGSTNNQVVTVTGANAIAGETNFIYDGTIVGCGADGANADLGAGLHIKTADSGASVASGADELVIENNGDAGITIASSTGGSAYINMADSGNNSAGRLGYDHNTDTMTFYTTSDGSASETMRLMGYGMLVGRTSFVGGTGAIIQVNADIKASGGGGLLTITATTGGAEACLFHNGNGEVGSISTSGSATAFNTSSDYRLKENETPITDGITRIKQLKPYKFNFKADADTTLDGFFAHEVSSIVPEAISGEKDAMIPDILYTAADTLPEGKNIGDLREATKIDPQKIDQSKLVPLLTSALQEAITKIETLESKVTALENA
jgi:hypothetical protein